MSRVDDFIKKVNETVDRKDVRTEEWFALEQEYLEINEDTSIAQKEKGKIWIKSRYEVVDMICSGKRYFKNQ